MNQNEDKWYCEYCDKTVKIGYVNRHIKSKKHIHEYTQKKRWNFKKQIEDKYYENEEHQYDDESEKSHMHRQAINKFELAWDNGYFDEFDAKHKIDFFFHYNIFHRFGIIQ